MPKKTKLRFDYNELGGEAWVNNIDRLILWAGVPDDDWEEMETQDEPLYQDPVVQRSITSMVIEDVLEREKQGFNAHGCPMTADLKSLREWLWDAYEETLDKAQYLRAAIEAIDNGTTE